MTEKSHDQNVRKTKNTQNTHVGRSVGSQRNGHNSIGLKQWNTTQQNTMNIPTKYTYKIPR